MKALSYSQRCAKVCWLCLVSILAPQWSNANPITINEFVNLIPRWETPHNAHNTIIGDGGRAYGRYQLHSTMVQDYNRITGRQVAHVVAFDPDFSKHIAKTILEYYSGVISRHGIVPTTDHWLFIWNGGGGAWKRVSNPINDNKQINLERYKRRAYPIINKYINEKKRRQSPKGA